MKQSPRQKCLQAFQLLRRLQESLNGYCTCISCGKMYKYTDMDAGHFISRRHKATELEPDNVWPQCKRCNRHLGGNYAEYRMRLLDKIGSERVNRLEKMFALSKGSDVLLSGKDQLSAVSVRSNQEYDELAKKFRKQSRDYND